jgi:dihydroxyacetone kinase
LLTEAGYQIVEPVVGEQCTSLDMAGVSLTIMFLDEELEKLWLAPCDTPAYRLGSVAEATGSEDAYEADEVETMDAIPEATDASRVVAHQVASLLGSVRDLLEANEAHLGDLDAVAGDGDHGIGMVRGGRAAAKAAAELAEQGAGAKTTLARAGDAWAERAGGTSGALWGAILRAVASHLDDSSAPEAETLRLAAISAVKAVQELGGAVPGDKTMVDAMAPFSSQLEEAPTLNAAIWSVAVAAAKDGVDSTTNIVARLGRARTHAGASLGTPDPGALSFALIVDRLGEASADLDHLPATTEA